MEKAGVFFLALVVAATLVTAVPAPARAGGPSDLEWALIGIGGADLLFNKGGLIREAVSLPVKVMDGIFGSRSAPSLTPATPHHSGAYAYPECEAFWEAERRGCEAGVRARMREERSAAYRRGYEAGRSGFGY